MMNRQLVEHIAETPQFTRLLRSRLRLGCLLSFIMVLLYTLFFLGMAYFPQLMGDVSIIGHSVSFGIWCAFALCFICLVFSWYYTWWANNKFDVMKEQYLQEVLHKSVDDPS